MHGWLVAPLGLRWVFPLACASLATVLLVACAPSSLPPTSSPSPTGVVNLPGPNDPIKLGAAVRRSDGNLWLIHSDGTWVRQLTSLAGEEGELSWSPDGRQIVFDATDGVYMVDVQTTVVRKLVDLSNWVGHAPAWSPKGDQILMSEGRLGLMRPDGTGLHLLAGPVPGEHATWSPDGTRITFAGTAPIQPWDIFTADADGTKIRDLTRNDFYEMAPAWSPDGTRIAYGAAPGNVRHVGIVVTTDIFVMDVDGTHPVNLTHGDPATPGFPKWLPDGRISFTTDAGELWLMDADGGHAHVIAAGVASAAWRP